jgi:SAM-dependent methyltransferase
VASEGIPEFEDPRLVAIYETVNAYAPGTQPDFYLALAEELGARSVVDLGCGTGLITRQFAARGLEVIGIDRAPRMLEVARSRPNSERVRWLLGGPEQAQGANADLAIMSGHVAQFFLDDESWRAALEGLRAALRPGGRLAFESRNPAAREWERWTPEHRSTGRDPDAGEIETWVTVSAVRGEVVDTEIHYRFLATGEQLVSPVTLRFRTREDLTRSLEVAGFALERTYGWWDRSPLHPDSPELILVARAV